MLPIWLHLCKAPSKCVSKSPNSQHHWIVRAHRNYLHFFCQLPQTLAGLRLTYLFPFPMCPKYRCTKTTGSPDQREHLVLWVYYQPRHLQNSSRTSNKLFNSIFCLYLYNEEHIFNNLIYNIDNIRALHTCRSNILNLHLKIS